ncbi:hypothetical protein CL657_03805 [bacterium]|nr:hypothetical protein [bacterium]
MALFLFTSKKIESDLNKFFEQRLNNRRKEKLRKKDEYLEANKFKDINVVNFCYHTPLYFATIEGNKEVVEVLITAGADVNRASPNFDEGWSPLHFAASEGDAEIVKVLVDAGAEVDKPNNKESTPLHLVVWRDHLEVCMVLVDAGANVDKPNENGSTPRNMALRVARRSTKIRSESSSHREIVNYFNQATPSSSWAECIIT